VAKKKPPLSTVVAFMSDATQAKFEGEDQPQVITTASLESILPDRDQPRRLLPIDLVEGMTAGALARVEALQAWVHRAGSETAEAGLRRNIRELKRLAASIEQHGLISPISVRLPRPDELVPPGTEYLIVTGERRYWAHVYLLSEGKQIHEGETIANPNEIKITLARPGVSVRAHQLIENLLREDINAVERARGMWALRYELSGINLASRPSEEIEESDDVNLSSHEGGEDQTTDVNLSSHEVIEGQTTDVNLSSHDLVLWSEVEALLGISRRYRAFVTSTLNLCQEAQDLIANHDLAELTIRPIIQKLRDKPELQVKALNQVIEWQAENEEEGGPGVAVVASVKELVEQLLASEATGQEPELTPPIPKRFRAVSSAPVIRFRNKVRQTLDFLGRLKDEDRAGLTEALYQEDFTDVVVDLRNLHQQLEVILQEVARRRPPEPEMPPLPTATNESSESPPADSDKT
jgi:hypothetical protein